MDMTEATNTPIEIELAGRKFKARQLTLAELFGHFESRVKTEALESARALTQGMEAGERRAFLSDAWHNLPRGKTLMDIARGDMETPSGVADILWLALRRDQPELTREAVSGLLTPASLRDLGAMILHLTGVGDQAAARAGQAEGNPGRRQRPPKA